MQNNTPLYLGFVQSKVGNTLEQASNNCVELKLAGQFMAEAGAVVRAVVAGFGTSCRISCDVGVECVHGVSISAGADKPSRDLWRVVVKQNPSSSNLDPPTEYIYAERVVLATGGHQTIPSSLSNASHLQKSVTSDFICTGKGVAWLNDRLMRAKVGGNNRDRKIVIVGGSHSAFSAAWICLNKVDSQAASFASGSVCILHRSPVPVFYNTKKEAELDGYSDFKHMNSMGQIHPFGGIRGDAKALYRQIRTMKEQRVRMLMIKGGSNAPAATKLFDEATVIIWACGYGTNLISVRDKDGEPYEFSTSGGQVEVDDEARVLCILKPDATPQTSAIIPPASPAPDGSPVRPTVSALLSPKSGGFIVVNNAPRRIVPVPNLFATGLGYGLKAMFENGEPDGSSGRADGVAVYLKRSATLILSSVLGSKVYGDNATSWKQRIANSLALAGAEKRQQNAAESDAPQPTSPPRPASSPTRSASSPVRSPAVAGTLKSTFVKQVREGFVTETKALSSSASPAKSVVQQSNSHAIPSSPIRANPRRGATAQGQTELSRSLTSSLKAPQSKLFFTKAATVPRAMTSTADVKSPAATEGCHTLPSISAGKTKPVSSRLFDASKMTRPVQHNKAYRLLEAAAPPPNVRLDTSNDCSEANQSPSRHLQTPISSSPKEEATACSSPLQNRTKIDADIGGAYPLMSPIRPRTGSEGLGRATTSTSTISTTSGICATIIPAADVKLGSLRHFISNKCPQLPPPQLMQSPASPCSNSSSAISSGAMASAKIHASGKRVITGWR